MSGAGGLYYGSSGGIPADLGDRNIFRSALSGGAMAFGGPVSATTGALSGYANLAIVYSVSSAYVSGNGTGIINCLWSPLPV